MIGFDVRNMTLEDYSDLIHINPILDYSIIKKIEKDKDSNIIVAQLNDDIIGYINYSILKDIDYKKIIVIDSIFVDEMYRGLGVAHQLMLEVEKNAKSSSIDYLVALTDNYIEEEIEFYNKQGFKLNSEKKYERKFYIQ